MLRAAHVRPGKLSNPQFVCPMLRCWIHDRERSVESRRFCRSNRFPGIGSDPSRKESHGNRCNSMIRVPAAVHGRVVPRCACGLHHRLVRKFCRLGGCPVTRRSRRRRVMRIQRRIRYESIAADIMTGYRGERASP